MTSSSNMTRKRKPPSSVKPSLRTAIYATTFRYRRSAHPVLAFLAGLGDDSERVTRAAIESTTDILSAGRVGWKELSWHELDHQCVNALRGRLQHSYAPATGNRMLSALRGPRKGLRCPGGAYLSVPWISVVAKTQLPLPICLAL